MASRCMPAGNAGERSHVRAGTERPTALLRAQGLVRQAEVIECGMDEEEEAKVDLGTRHSQPLDADGDAERTGGTLLSRLGPESSGELVLYQRGVPSSAFVLVLQARSAPHDEDAPVHCFPGMFGLA